jgi:HEAT repeats/PBS lyase HEAT-like repeat
VRLRRRAVDHVIGRRSASVSARVEQAKWVVILLMRENPPGCLQFADRRINADEFDADVALGAFSRAVSRGDPDERFVAVEALAWMRDPRAISPLIRGLRDPLWHLRHAAAQGLAQFRPLPDWALQPLCTAIGDPEPAVRAEAAGALGSLDSLGSLRPLVCALDDRFRCVRLAAAWALDDLGDAGIFHARAADRLERLLDGEDDPYIAYAAYWALGAQRGSNAPRAAFRWSDWGQTVWQAVTGT